MKIYKYKIPVTDSGEITIHGTFVKILKVAEQNGDLCMWALISDPECGHEDTLTYTIIGTGNEVDARVIANSLYNKTVVMSDGFVWHVFIFNG